MKSINRRNFLKVLSFGAASLAMPGCANGSQQKVEAHKSRPPNFIIIFCDDLGYGDIGCFGSKKHRTPTASTLPAACARPRVRA